MRPNVSTRKSLRLWPPSKRTWFAEQAGRDADFDRSVAGVECSRGRYAFHCSIYARLLNLREVLANDM